MELGDSGYDSSDASIANYDQLKAHAIDQLRKCDSFVAATGFVDDEAASGMRLILVSATKTPFTPYFLAEVSAAASQLVVVSIEKLSEVDDEAEA